MKLRHIKQRADAHMQARAQQRLLAHMEALERRARLAIQRGVDLLLKRSRGPYA